MPQQTMRAMVLREWGGQLELADVPKPTPEVGEALVKVGAAGVGLTVLNRIDGLNRSAHARLPMIPGHEVAGTVTEVGLAVTDVKPGDRVCHYAYWNCGYCQFCLRGREPLCTNLLGHPGDDKDGPYAEYFISPAANLVPLPAEISFTDGSAIPDAITTSYHVTSDRARTRPGDLVAIIGAAGGVGIHMVQMMRLFGGEVIAVDKDDAKLERTREYGASTLINPMHQDASDRFQVAAPGGCDVVVDLVGRPETLKWAVQALGRGGRAIFLTTFPGQGTGFEPRDLVVREASLIGSRASAKHELLTAIELVRTRRIRPVVSEVVSLEEVETIHQKLRAGAFLGRGAIAFD